jgi:hypothetical protein
LLALIAAGDDRSDSIAKGVRWLLERQRRDGGWDESMGEGARRQSIITGTGFPKVFYLAYTMYRQYFPLLALTGYKRVMERIYITDSEVYRLNTAKAEVVEVASAAQSLSSQYRRTVVEFRLRVAAWLFRYRTAFLKRISRRHQGKHSEVIATEDFYG